MSKKTEARALWNAIATETARGGNTAARVGAAGERVIQALEDVETAVDSKLEWKTVNDNYMSSNLFADKNINTIMLGRDGIYAVQSTAALGGEYNFIYTEVWVDAIASRYQHAISTTGKEWRRIVFMEMELTTPWVNVEKVSKDGTDRLLTLLEADEIAKIAGKDNDIIISFFGNDDDLPNGTPDVFAEDNDLWYSENQQRLYKYESGFFSHELEKQGVFYRVVDKYGSDSFLANNGFTFTWNGENMAKVGSSDVTKVDKDGTKQLSTNDYTTIDKAEVAKVAGKMNRCIRGYEPDPMRLSELVTIGFDFTGYDFSNINFVGYTLFLGHFRGANFEGAILNGCALNSSDFTGASFRNASLVGAGGFFSAIITDADFNGSDLTNATGFFDSDITIALDGVKKYEGLVLNWINGAQYIWSGGGWITT